MNKEYVWYCENENKLIIMTKELHKETIVWKSAVEFLSKVSKIRTEYWKNNSVLKKSYIGIL